MDAAEYTMDASAAEAWMSTVLLPSTQLISMIVLLSSLSINTDHSTAEFSTMHGDG